VIAEILPNNISLQSRFLALAVVSYFVVFTYQRIYIQQYFNWMLASNNLHSGGQVNPQGQGCPVIPPGTGLLFPRLLRHTEICVF
jgi:hypothetical protein